MPLEKYLSVVLVPQTLYSSLTNHLMARFTCCGVPSCRGRCRTTCHRRRGYPWRGQALHPRTARSHTTSYKKKMTAATINITGISPSRNKDGCRWQPPKDSRGRGGKKTLIAGWVHEHHRVTRFGAAPHVGRQLHSPTAACSHLFYSALFGV